MMDARMSLLLWDLQVAAREWSFESLFLPLAPGVPS
jgi:hypothetical protein